MGGCGFACEPPCCVQSKEDKNKKKRKTKKTTSSHPRYRGSSVPSRSMRGGLLAMIKVGLGACAALLVLVSWGLVVLFVLGSSGWRVGVFGSWSAVLGSYPIWGIVCGNHKEALFFSNF